jgi:hypothetical protein
MFNQSESIKKRRTKMVVSDKWFYFQISELNYEIDDPQIGILIQVIKRGLPQVVVISKNCIANIDRIHVNSISVELQGEIYDKIEPGYYAYLLNKNDFLLLYKSRSNKLIFSKWYKVSSSGFRCDWVEIAPKASFDSISRLLLQLVTYLIYSEEKVERRVRSPKTHTSDGKKLINNTGASFTLIDTSWNRKLIITNGVQVRGFWRLQRYGKKWSKRKLKYIDSFYRGPMVRRSGRERYNTKYGNEIIDVKK